MISLRGARVLLIDDSLNESIPVIKACSKMGISIAYFDGNINELPPETEKLTGIRLAILDMDLGGAGDTDENKISTLISRLQAILAAENGPYTMVTWTKHSHLVDLLDTKLFTLYQVGDHQDKVSLPVVCIRLEKKDFLIKPDVFDIEKLSSTIESELKKTVPVSIMQAWEERCIRAASGVTNILSEMIAPQGDSPNGWRVSWNKEYLNVLTLLAKEEVGDNNLSADTYYKALIGALNPLQFDFLESDHIPLPVLPDDFFPLPTAKRIELAGQINTKMHISFQNGNQFSPGNIYKLVDCAEIMSIQPKKIFDDLVIQTRNEDALYDKTTPILLEISAACDFAQSKIKFARFLAGLVVPQCDLGKFKQPCYKHPFEALLSVGPLWIEEQDYCILISSQYFISLELDQVKYLKPFVRLRNQWLTNIQFWLAQQISRPGVVMLR